MTAQELGRLMNEVTGVDGPWLCADDVRPHEIAVRSGFWFARVGQRVGGFHGWCMVQYDDRQHIELEVNHPFSVGGIGRVARIAKAMVDAAKVTP